MKRGRKLKGKTLGPFSKKELEEEIKEEVKRDIKPAIRSMMSYPDMNIALGNSVNQFTQAQKYKLWQGLQASMKQGIDYDYLKAVIFPELFASDIPQPYTNISYCRFSDRSNVTVGSGIGGDASMLWYPRTSVGPSLYYLDGTATDYPNYPTNMQSTATNLLQYGFNQDYSSYFTQCNLVAASITVQYIGQLEQEAGFMVGSHIFGVDPQLLTFDDIENGQYVTRCRPSEGLRFVYLPADSVDYELYPCSPVLVNGTTYTGNTHNSGASPTGNERTVQMPIYFAASNAANDSVFLNGKNQAGTQAVAGSIPTQYTTAAGSQFSQSVNPTNLIFNTNTNYVGMYWVGLNDGVMWFRVDQMRRFIGLPKSNYRDIVELVRSKKNFDSKQTFDILRTLCINSPVGGHTLKELDRNQDQLVDGLMNANEAVHLGHLTGVETLADLNRALQLSNENQKGLTENYGLSTRIYPYTI